MKEVIKYYIFGYLNTYYLAVKHLKGKNITYKDFKLTATASYLNIDSKYLGFVFPVISFFEVPLSCIIVTIRFFQSLVKWMFTRKKRFTDRLLLLGAGEVKTKQLIKSTDLRFQDITIVLIPYVNKSLYSGFDSVSIFSGIEFVDILCSYINSIKTILIISNKYWKRDVATRSYSSFEFFLGHFYICRSAPSNTFLFTSLTSRWAILHGHIDHQTIFLQHGWLSPKTHLLKKIGTATKAYYISKQQQDICERCLLNNKPFAFYLKEMQFNIKPDNDKINVLLVSEYNYREKELKIIEDIYCNKHLRLFVKPHPKDKDIEVFKKLKETKGFILLQGYNFPEVDYVISYESTLALEYEMKGIKVLLYNNIDFEDEYTKLLSLS